MVTAVKGQRAYERRGRHGGTERTGRSASDSENSGVKTRGGPSAKRRPLNSTGSGPSSAAPSLDSIFALHVYTSSSACVALCVGALSAALARASSGEFFAGEYDAQTCTRRGKKTLMRRR